MKMSIFSKIHNLYLINHRKQLFIYLSIKHFLQFQLFAYLFSFFSHIFHVHLYFIF